MKMTEFQAGIAVYLGLVSLCGVFAYRGPFPALNRCAVVVLILSPFASRILPESVWTVLQVATFAAMILVVLTTIMLAMGLVPGEEGSDQSVEE